MPKYCLIAYCIAAIAWPYCAAYAAVFGESDNPYLSMSIEDLMRVPLSIAAKKEKALSDTAAAVFVLNHEDIKRSGATSIPELLRLVPGFDVERVDGHTWAVAARFPSSSFSPQLLVMIDGRSVFTPLFAGVYWDALNVMFEDIDKIEIVRGSGGAVWGANAVNAVINIITKSAHDTQGGLITAGMGNQITEQEFGDLRYGFKLGDSGAARIYAKGFNRNDANIRANAPVSDWQEQRTGFRADWDMGQHQFTLDGEAYKGHESSVSTVMSPTAPLSQRTTYQSQLSGGHLLGLWQYDGLSVQAYFDRTSRSRLIFSEQRNTYDLDVKYHFDDITNHDIQLGAGYRLSNDLIRSTFTIFFNPASRHDSTYSAFIQDEITLSPTWALTLGSKFEHNPYSGFEYAPSISLLWKASDTQRFWASASRAYVPPSRADKSMGQAFVNSTSFKLGLVPNSSLETTDTTTFELGHRIQINHQLSLDSTAYYSDSRKAISTSRLPFDTANSFLGLKTINGINTQTYGVEFSALWQVFESWRIKGHYSWRNTQAQSRGTLAPLSEVVPYEKAGVPKVWSLSSSVDLPQNITFDIHHFVVDSSKLSQTPAYNRTDIRLGWQPSKVIETSIAMQNVFNLKHKEGRSSSGSQATFGPSLYGQINWTF